jgi:hypothetical protein
MSRITPRQEVAKGNAGSSNMTDHDLPESRQDLTMESLAKGKTIPYGSQIYRDGKNTFEANLENLREICRDKGVPLILSTQVSNLRGYPPFVSLRPGNLTSENRQKIDAAIASGERPGSTPCMQGHDSPSRAAWMSQAAGSKPAWNMPGHGTMISCVSARAEISIR